MQSTSLRSAALVAAVVVSACSPMAGMMSGSSATVPLRAQLDARQEVPPNGSTATGMMEGRLDRTTSLLTWRVTYSGLTGPATAAHFHGPAAAGQNAGVVLPFKDAANPIMGSATLTSAQVEDLLAGRWYVNVHTAANPGGEIRGQVTAAK